MTREHIYAFEVSQKFLFGMLELYLWRLSRTKFWLYFNCKILYQITLNWNLKWIFLVCKHSKYTSFVPHRLIFTVLCIWQGINSSKSMSPDSKEFCPNSWFEVDKEMHQDGFCKQVSWKCCFICVCLPVCYPCYLSRTIRWVVVDIFTILMEIFEQVTVYFMVQLQQRVRFYSL